MINLIIMINDIDRQLSPAGRPVHVWFPANGSKEKPESLTDDWQNRRAEAQNSAKIIKVTYYGFNQKQQSVGIITVKLIWVQP